jgi:hypothetical protein
MPDNRKPQHEELSDLLSRIVRLEDAHKNHVVQIASLQSLVKKLELRVSDLEGPRVEIAP